MPLRITSAKGRAIAIFSAGLLASTFHQALAETPGDVPPPLPELNAPAAPAQASAVSVPDVPDAALDANILTAPPAAAGGSGNGNVADVPFMQWVLANNATVTPLGNVGGLEGWLLSNKVSQQTIYITPDGKHAVIGIMAAIGGEDITGLQLTALMLGHAPVITKSDPSGRGTPQSAQTISNSPPSPPPAPAANQNVQSSVSAGAMPAGASPIAAAMGQLATAEPDMNELDVTPTQMAKAIDNTAVFTVGAPGKPDLVMLADPNCPYCHASWTLLGPLVQDGKIDVTVILIDWLNGSKEKALDLLANPDVADAWDAGQGSVDGVPVSSPGPKADMKLAAYYLAHNEAFAKAVDINGTPTLIWVARKDAKSPYKVFKGTGLAGVGGFLTAVQDSQVATMR
jgi:protein-disulfide isomerase